MNDYWQKQQPGKPLFGDVLWSKPERRDQAGRLTIVGGNSRGFWAVAAAYQVAHRIGVGQIRVIMPDSLRQKLPAPVRLQMDDLMMVDSNPSGGLAMGAIKYLHVAADWSHNLLFIGDNGANSETAQLLEKFLADSDYFDTTVTVARDAVDLVIYGAETILNRPKCNLVVSLSQLQKLAKAVYYPRIISFHGDNLFVANGGQVVSQPFDEPMRVWNGEIPTRAAAWLVWHDQSVPAVATSWTELNHSH